MTYLFEGQKCVCGEPELVSERKCPLCLLQVTKVYCHLFSLAPDLHLSSSPSFFPMSSPLLPPGSPTHRLVSAAALLFLSVKFPG